MIVTEIEDYSKKKRVYIDEQFAFTLYPGEIYKYQIRSGYPISEADYNEIINEVILKRAKKRALYLLTAMGRTEKQLRAKLKQNDYTENIVNQVIEYVKQYNYINDEAYVKNYIECYGERKSKQKIEMELYHKGISKEKVKKVYEECDLPNEKKMIQKWIEKKNFNIDKATQKEVQKMFHFLARKGFRLEDIKNELCK